MKLSGRIDLKLHGISKPLRAPGKISIRKIIRHLCLGNAGNADNVDNANNADNADNADNANNVDNTGIKSFHIRFFLLNPEIAEK